MPYDFVQAAAALGLRLGYNDLNSDGVMDAVCFIWNDRLALFHSESGCLPWPVDQEGRDWNAYFNAAFDVEDRDAIWNEERAAWGTYTILVDRDQCGRFDSDRDFYFKALDLDGDGRPEAEYYHLVGYPGFGGNDPQYSNKMHAVLDGERDISSMDFKTFGYAEEQHYRPNGQYYMNVHGNGFFVNSYSPDPLLSWETPIAWYDFDFDGRTDMVMRCADTHKEGELYRGDIDEFEVAFELNGNTTPEHYHSLDFQLTYYALHRKGIPYAGYIDSIPHLAPPKALLPFCQDKLRERGRKERAYLPYLDGYKIGTDFPDWEGVWMIFDEDDDDNRWEELFAKHETKENASGDWYKCADKIGDRIERDTDFGGKGQLYVGAFDGRIHLYHAEEAFWDIDYLGIYKGSSDRKFALEGLEPPAGLLYPRVRYLDADGDGFIDRVEYGTVAYGDEERSWKAERVVNLRDYFTDDELRRPLTDPRVEMPLTGWKLENWGGKPLSPQAYENAPCHAAYRKMRDLYDGVAADLWEGANLLYECAKRHGLNRSEALDKGLQTVFTAEELLAKTDVLVPQGYSRHLDGGDRRSQYHDGYWLREKVFEDILAYSGLAREPLLRCFYRGEIAALCEHIDRELDR